MSTISQQTGSEIKLEISAVYNKIKFHLNKDTSDAKAVFTEAMTDYLAKSAATPGDLVTLQQAIYTYQNQLESNQITLYNSAQELSTAVTAKVHANAVGYASLNSNSAKEHVYGLTYPNIMGYIQSNVADLESPSFATINTALFTAIERLSDGMLTPRVLLDMYAGRLSTYDIQTSIAAIDSNSADQFTIVSDLYNAFSTSGFTLSDVDGASRFNDALTTAINNSSFGSVAFSIYLSVVNLSSPTIPNIANAIASAMGTGDNTSLINSLALDMYSSLLSASEIQAAIGAISEMDAYDGPSMVVAFYAAFNNGSASAITGALSLISNIADFETAKFSLQGIATNQVEYTSYAQLATDIASAVGYNDSDLIRYLALDMAATGIAPSVLQQSMSYVDGANVSELVANVYNAFSKGERFGLLSSYITNYHFDEHSYEDIVNSVRQIGSSESIYSVQDLVDALKTLFSIGDEQAASIQADIELSGFSIDYIKSYLTQIVGSDADTITLSIYQTWSPAYVSAMQGALNLAAGIDYQYNNYSKSYEDSLADIKSAVSALSNTATNHEVAIAISNIVDDFNSFKDYLELDLIYSGLSIVEIKTAIDNLSGVDGIEITSNFYKVLGFPYASAIFGEFSLKDRVASYSDSDYVVTLASQEGSVDISPSADYLNKCTISEEGVYTVGGSVFINFDADLEGKALSDMSELGTDTGNFAAMAQCGAWIEASFDPDTGFDMYLTKTQAAGVTGNSDVTGCSDALDAGLAMAKCYSIFVHYIT
jgi:hypothetical protein